MRCIRISAATPNNWIARLLVGGVADHVHLLARFGRTRTQAESRSDAPSLRVVATPPSPGIR